MYAFRLLTAIIFLVGAATLAGCEKKPERDFKDNPNPAPPPGPVGGDPGADPDKTGDSDKANRAEADKRLKTIGVAMHKFEGAFQHFPAGIAGPKGDAGLSWRVQILPFLGKDEAKLYEEFKLAEAWDSEHNKKLISKMPKVFATPGKDSGEGKTHLRSFAGETAFIPAPLPPQSPNLKPGFPIRGRRITDITDGTSNTLMVVEAAEAVEWTKPDELPFRGLRAGKPPVAPKLGGLFGDRFADHFHAVTCDGAVRFLSTDIFTDDVVARMITVNGGEVLPRDANQWLFLLKPKKPLPPTAVPADLPDAAARTTAVANYLAVWKGAQMYHDLYGYLPAGIMSKDGVGLSWRVQILPYIGEEKLYKEFKLTEPWDSDHNKKLIDRMPKVFESPGKPAEKGYTFLRTTQGPGGIVPTPPPGPKGTPGESQAGRPLAGRTMPAIAIQDGTSDTILFVEAAEAGPWTKPDELVLAVMPKDTFTKGARKEPTLPKLGGAFDGGFHAVMAEARVTFYKSDYPVQELAKLFCPDDGLLIDPLGEPDKILYSVTFVPVQAAPLRPKK